ncbi:MAG TPA: RNA 2',3'-cyclic phosphodiesterase [Pyrinomonadaceae bacterium]
MPDHYRTFAAIELPGNIRDRIQQHINELKSKVPESHPSWTQVDNIHLTIKFFGNVETNKIADITEAATRVSKNFTRFKIAVGGTGAFPKPGQPRVLWIGIEDLENKLAELQRSFENECAMAGFTKEDRDFRPHLTIARIRKPEGARGLAEVNNELGFEAMELTVNELVVFRSELSSQGSKYTALSRHPLSDVP